MLRQNRVHDCLKMIDMRIELICDGCVEKLTGDGSQFPSVAHARDAGKTKGWQMIKIHNRLFDFCRNCIDEGKRGEPREAIKKWQGQ